MEAKEYIFLSGKTECFNWLDDQERLIVPYGLLGESGSLAEVVKKSYRDIRSSAVINREIVEEVGDLLWYICAVARRYNVGIDVWPEPISVDDYPTSIAFESLNLSRMCIRGDVVGMPEVEGVIIRLLSMLQGFLGGYDVGLSDVSEHAHRKNDGYWNEAASGVVPVFDSGLPVFERLPRKFKVDFLEVDAADESIGPELMISINGIQIGDRLTDNTHEESGYRYHDVFHMCAAVTLGWSPVFRRMLKRKRKSIPDTDVNEDGARAAIIEEAIVGQVYVYAYEHDFDVGEHPDVDLIKTLMKLVQPYECRDLRPRDWKRFIRVSVALFGLVKNGFSGSIHFDADSSQFYSIDPHSISYEMPL